MGRQAHRQKILKAVPEALTPIKAIREKCVDCVCGHTGEIEKCPCKDCSLWPYRFGFNPYVKSNSKPPQLTEQQKVANAARLREMAEKRRAEKK